ncbi:protein HEG homolog 1 isoform X2 [Etheostoma spectabile]|uniref:protein HEG homolog 1 isoform X2 n=1 Tax=Etheostoma spectabile TaxID=54343 RepID=UPI0013AF8FBA|nr:protein HEG homolog 1-like isoform X2 [Etheostoma spectabile]
MFFSYLPVVCLLGAVVKGLTTDPFTLNSSSITSTNETTSQISTESRTTTAAVIENSNFTHPTGSPSGPTSGTKMSPASPETTHPTNTMIGHTTLRPTDMTTKNSTTTPISSTTTISTGTTNTGPTLRPTDMTTNNSTTAAPTLPPFIVCPAASCPLESICLNGTCQCLSGSFLVKGRCVPAQVFPGQLHMTSLTFDNEMSNRSSAIFQRTAAEISAALKNALKNHMGYQQSDVVQLEPGSVQATVNNIFEKTNATQESVDQVIKQAIAAAPAGGVLADATFTATNLCEQKQLSPCDISTTTCTNTNGRAVCSCKEGYISNDYTNKICTACESGWRAVGDTCQPCAFGYAGFNCNDSALLAVVVISCVLGGVLLIIVLALLIYFCWRRCSKSKQDHNSSPYSSGDINQPWPTGITPIPRATSNCYEAPPIEMAEGGNNRVPVDKYQTNGLGFPQKLKGWKKSGSYDLNPDTMHTFKGKNPSRYSYLVQGHENPYFLPGEDKRD